MKSFYSSTDINEFIAKRKEIIDSLTPRELDVLQLLTKGMTNKEMADALSLSPGTIRIYLSNIYLKLEVSTRTQAAILARDLGI